MKTTIDWLAFRTRSTPYQVVEAMAPMFGTASDLVTFRSGGKGKDGWLYAGELLMAGDINMGRIDYGGESQRGWCRVNLTGQGCEWVQDWREAVALSTRLLEAQIKRLDIALTTYEGQVTDQTIVDAYASGMFTAGGRPPEMRSITSSDSRAGKTRYIGSRQSHKFLRCYEKGFELIKDIPFFKATLTHIDGKKVEDIYRVELELKDVDKLIPWEAIMGRDQVFAGAYPFCAELLPGVPHWRMLTLPDLKPKAALETALNHCRVAYGPTLRAALMAFNGDGCKLLERVLAETPSHALVEAGVLTVDHV
jgi:DNA relaxase NicK